MEIKIICNAADCISLEDLSNFQGEIKKISKKNLSKLKESIIKYGFSAPIFVWKHRGKNFIIDGHQTIKAIKALKLSGYTIPPLPVAFIEAENKAEAKEKLLQITSQYGEYDLEALDSWINDIDEIIRDSIRLVDSSLNIKKKTTSKDENVSFIDSITKIGDVWELNNHKLICDDSFSIGTLPKYDILIYDPPYERVEFYNLIPEYQKGKKLLIFWDFKRFGLAPHKAIMKNWNPQYEFIWNCIQSWYTPNRPLQQHKACGYFSEDPFFDTENSYIQDNKKRKSGFVNNTRGVSAYKPSDSGKHLSTVESISNASLPKEYKHSKPLDWIKAIFGGIGEGIYLDLFAGSGMTLLCCEMLGYSSINYEILPENCDLIVTQYIKALKSKGEKIIIKLNNHIIDYKTIIKPE